MLVLDEADRMLDMGFIRDVRKIVGFCNKERQTLLFSATMPLSIANLAHDILRNPVRVDISPVKVAVERIEQRVYFVGSKDKRAVLTDLLKAPTMGQGNCLHADQARRRPSLSSSCSGGTGSDRDPWQQGSERAHARARRLSQWQGTRPRGNGHRSARYRRPGVSPTLSTSSCPTTRRAIFTVSAARPELARKARHSHCVTTESCLI